MTAFETHPHYELAEVDGRIVITCRTCGRTSTHWKDVWERYCGYCHRFHLDPDGRGEDASHEHTR